MAVGEEGAVAVGRRGGAVAVGEDSYVGVGRYGGVVAGERYESHEGWKIAAGVGAGIAIGTMLARPPAASTTVVGGVAYQQCGPTYYQRVSTGHRVVVF